MIEKMKRVILVCLAEDQDSTLAALRDLEIMHVQPLDSSESTELAQAIRQREAAERLRFTVSDLKPDGDGDEFADMSAEEIGATGAELLEAIAKAREGIDHWQRVEEQLRPWGDFDAELLERLRQQEGLTITLCAAPEAAAPAGAPAEAVMVELARHEGTLYFAVVGQGEISAELPEAKLPEGTLREAQDSLARCTKELAEHEGRLAELAHHDDKLGELCLMHLDSCELLATRDGMGEADRFVYVGGYVPEARIEALTAAARSEGWGLMINDPAEDDRDVPTLIRYPAWVKPIKAVFDLIGIMPGYREVDCGALFLVFFSFFFAVLISDAAYGAIILALTLAVWAKFKRLPKEPFILMVIMALVTIVWGVLTGVYFGAQRLPAALESMVVKPLQSEAFFMKFCFLVAVIHLTLAHLWNVMIFRRSLKLLNQIGWIMVIWANFFLANALVLAEEFPTFCWYLYIGGAVLVIVFNNPSRKIGELLSGGVMDILMNGINSLVDVISYVRLFAVSSAALALEISFNQMAADVGMDNWLRGLMAAAILVAGHGLNILLGFMSVLVHGIRLNTLEFSGHLGLEWSGVSYAPFHRTTTKNQR